MAEVAYALSIKQPWATLLLHGLKTIEVRSWPTARRGRILIHAAKQSATDPAIWALLPAALHETAQQRGGLVGACELTGCLVYPDREAFAADRPRHLNDPDWFAPPALYGFTVAHPEPLPFRAYPGWVRFFPIKDDVPQRQKIATPASAPTLFPETPDE